MRRVAVIAVHGVADQKPNEASAAIASMLTEHTSNPTGRAAYTPFIGHETHIAQHPVVSSSQGAGKTVLRDTATGESVVPQVLTMAAAQQVSQPRPSVFQISERRDYAQAITDKIAGSRPGEKKLVEGDLGLEFMRMQLKDYIPGSDTRTNVTTVLSGRRIGPPPTEPAVVKRVSALSKEPVENVPAVERRTADDHSAATAHSQAREHVYDDTQPGSEGQSFQTDEPVDVDIYEVHWADLSRLASGPFAFLGASYQVLLHIATLGRQAVDDAAVAATASESVWVRRVWALMNFLQRWAVRFLTLPVPMLNLVLLVVTVGIIPVTLVTDATWRAYAAVGLVFGAIGAWIAYVAARRWVPRPPGVWAVVPLLAAAVAASIPIMLITKDVLSSGAAAIICWWIVGGLFVLFVALKYEVMRPGAVVTAMISYGFALVAFLYLSAHQPAGIPESTSVERAFMQTMEATFGLLRLSWIFLLACVVGLVLFWPFAWGLTRRETVLWSQGRAALRTGRLAISLSVTAFLLLTILGWTGVFAFSVEKFAPFKNTGVVTLPRGIPRVIVPDSVNMARLDFVTAEDTVDSHHFTAPEYFQGLIAESVTASGPVSLALAISAILLLLWMALPSVMTELKSPTFCTNVESKRMGWWLSQGLDATRWVGHLLLVASCLAPVVFGLWELRIPGGWFIETTYGMVGKVGTSIAASAIVLLTLLAKYGGSALDVMLDVDNYLRTTPIDATPRARIAERYVSVLRHVASNDSDGNPRYDRVIIVAHSLGALITAELLKFLKNINEDPSLYRLGFGPRPEGKMPGPTLPISLMTMGNPLRQLLCRFFPHRYDWVRATPDNGSKPLKRMPGVIPVSTDPTRPMTSLLGVSQWENAYRSGDYVGRSVWLDEWYNRNDLGDGQGKYRQEITLAVQPGSTVNSFAEYCIGAGGHTHYWDHTAPDIADRLDALIAGD